MSLRRSILVAEDDRAVRDLVRTTLEAAGFDVRTAGTGLEALRQIEETPPDAIVLDINMPEMDGFGVLTWLRSRRSSTPVLVLTARHVAGDVRRAIGLGARDYLAKPFKAAQLQARTARLLRDPFPDEQTIEVIFE